MIRSPLRALALLSGLPALVYQVVWTRELGLQVGGQIEAISVVLVAFFGGLGLGARVFGAASDRVRSPLRLYALLEAGASLFAVASIPLLRSLGRSGIGIELDAAAWLLGGAAMLPTSVLLGGTLPALLCASRREPEGVAARAGRLVAWNTAGSVLGICAAILAMPRIGLQLSVWGAALGGLALAGFALQLARRDPAESPRPRAPTESAPASPGILVAAAVAGMVTLAWEVLCARLAALQLGSTLYAWGAVLALFLLALASGNAIAAQRAAKTDRPARELAALEFGAALAVSIGAAMLAPGVAEPARGLTLGTAAAMLLGVFPPALLMGAAFPYFVRLGVRSPGVGAPFGAISGANTAGGMLGALGVPFALLPALGPMGVALVCAGTSAILGSWFRVRGGGDRWAWLAPPGLVAGAWLVLAGDPPSRTADGAWVVHAAHGRQASVVVVHRGDRRDLFVDGEAEASTGGSARRTEELLAVLPLLLHPDPQRFLEIGFGSGITLATAARFPLERLDCVELAGSVLDAAPFFSPDNRNVASGTDPRIRLVRGDGRAFLATRVAAYDIVVANTLHPWSVGGTGLHSREYFSRMAAALRPGGVAVQWLPVDRISADALALILRTMVEVFPDGSLWWGAGNLLVVGRVPPHADADPLRRRARSAAARAALRALDIADAASLEARRLADFAALRAELGAGPVLRDDVPRLEALTARGPKTEEAGALGLVQRIVERAAQADSVHDAQRLWIEGELARSRGETARAAKRNALARAAGSPLAHEAHVAALRRRAHDALAQGDLAAATASFESALDVAPRDRTARHGLGFALARSGALDRARAEAERLVADHPDAAEGWLLLGEIARARGEDASARAAFERALAADPHLPQARAALAP